MVCIRAHLFLRGIPSSYIFVPLPSFVLPSLLPAPPSEIVRVSPKNSLSLHSCYRVDAPVLFFSLSSCNKPGKTTSGNVGLVFSVFVVDEAHNRHMEDTDTIRRSSDVYMFLFCPSLSSRRVQMALPRRSQRHIRRNVGIDKLCTAIFSRLSSAAWHL